MDFMSLITESALPVVPVLWVIGAILKRTPKVPNWTIPYWLLAIGVGLCFSLLGLNTEAVIQGVLVTGAAVLGHQLYKQTLDCSGRKK